MPSILAPTTRRSSGGKTWLIVAIGVGPLLLLIFLGAVYRAEMIAATLRFSEWIRSHGNSGKLVYVAAFAAYIVLCGCDRYRGALFWQRTVRGITMSLFCLQAVDTDRAGRRLLLSAYHCNAAQRYSEVDRLRC